MITPEAREAAQRTLESRDWSGAKVDQSPTGSKTVLVGRFPPNLAARVIAEAGRRGAKVSEVLRDPVAEAFAARGAAGMDERVTVRFVCCEGCGRWRLSRPCR
mgnify:CR=1 FL=1